MTNVANCLMKRYKAMCHFLELKVLPAVRPKEGLQRKLVENSDPVTIAKQLLGKVRSD